MSRATIMAVVNQKGGTGKTTTCENLGIGLANEGKRVLLVDTDPQASLTIALGHPRPDDLPVTLTDLMAKVISLQTGVTMNLKRKARPCVIAERCMKQGFLLSVRGSCMRGSYGTRFPRSTRTGLKWHRSSSEDPAFSWFAAIRWMARSKTISVWQRGSVLPLQLLTAL